MTTKSGHDVRLSILDDFDVLHVWDLGDTRLFEAAVLPAVLLLRKKTEGILHPGPRFTSIYSTDETNSTPTCDDAVSALSKSGVVRLQDGQSFLVRHGRLDCGPKPGEVWRIATEASDEWLSRVGANTSGTFRDIGRTRVGVKTTADHVFIRSDWEDMPEPERPELLKPLATHHIARRFRAVWPERRKQIVYPHQTVDGKRSTVNLEDFPRTARYLNSFRSVLEGREYVAEAGRAWFEIWVPQDPDSWSKPKIVFRDIAQTPTFWMDLEGCVVNGDCYWLACERPDQIDLLWLALAVANSTFVEAYYDHRFHNKLYAGRRRFMTQYVERFPLPSPSTLLAREIIRGAKEIYDLIPSPGTEPLEQKLDKMVWQAFGVSPEEVVR
jgi:adenine-specific DNA-methyltransferase